MGAFQGVTPSFHSSDYQFFKEFYIYHLIFLCVHGIIYKTNLLLWEVFSLNNKDLILKSYDHKYYKNMAITFSILFAVLVVPLAIVFAFLGKPEASLTFVILMLFFFAPLIGYYIAKLFSIRKNPDSYKLFDAVATEMHPSFARKMYLTIQVKDCNGASFTVYTSGIFMPGAASSLCFDDKYKRNLQVLYDSTSDRLLVLC